MNSGRLDLRLRIKYTAIPGCLIVSWLRHMVNSILFGQIVQVSNCDSVENPSRIIARGSSWSAAEMTSLCRAQHIQTRLTAMARCLREWVI